ncbi:MAG: hypothetical protein K8R92_10710 [Planctomycetes bacterium]|nr:hypothetical protein [Planctomycetota bacterium]
MAAPHASTKTGTTAAKKTATTAAKKTGSAASTKTAAPLSIKPGAKVTFKVIKIPASESSRKTIFRLMRMEDRVQKALTKLAKKRAKTDNRHQQRGGRTWIARKTASRVVVVKKGASFTISYSNQLAPDIRSVQKYLEQTSK